MQRRKDGRAGRRAGVASLVVVAARRTIRIRGGELSARAPLVCCRVVRIESRESRGTCQSMQ